MTSSFSAFNSLLAHGACTIFPKEAFDKYGDDMRVKCVGTGPFMIDAIDEGVQVRLVKNPTYWEKDEHGNQSSHITLMRITDYVLDWKMDIGVCGGSNVNNYGKVIVSVSKDGGLYTSDKLFEDAN